MDCRRLHSLDARYYRAEMVPSAWIAASLFVITLAFGLLACSANQSIAAGCGIGALLSAVWGLCMLGSMLVSGWKCYQSSRKAHPSPLTAYPRELVRARHLFFSLPQQDRVENGWSCLRAVHEKLSMEGVEVSAGLFGMVGSQYMEVALRCGGHLLTADGSSNFEFKVRPKATPLSLLDGEIVEIPGNGWDYALDAKVAHRAQGLLAKLVADELAEATPLPPFSHTHAIVKRL